MTNQQAASKAKKQWGREAYIRSGDSMSSPERRTVASETIQKARAETKRIDEEIERRLKELDWYQELLRQRRECREQISKVEGNAMYYRFSVGKFNGWANHIIGWGDTWEEAFAMAAEKGEQG